MHHKVEPFLCGEVLALLNIVLNIDVGNLDRLQCLNIPAYLNILTLQIANGNDTPDTIT